MITGLVHDDRVMLHEGNVEHPESPMRHSAIHSHLKKEGILDKCLRVRSKVLENEKLSPTHTKEYIDSIFSIKVDSDDYLMIDSDTFFNRHSAETAKLAAGSLVHLCEQVMEGNIANGMSILRPPGHHAESDKAMGFCIFNNVAIAADQLLLSYEDCKRVLIIDWDVHHGNGTEEIFYDRDDVLFMSIHQGGDFYPWSGPKEDIGEGAGEGYTVNFPINGTGLGDETFVYVFEEVFLPIAKEFNPDFVIISAGFDAAVGDPVGGMMVSPRCFGVLTKMCMEINAKLVLSLEGMCISDIADVTGGYNLRMIANCARECCEALLGEEKALRSVDSVPHFVRRGVNVLKKSLSKYWKCMQAKDTAVELEIHEESEDEVGVWDDADLNEILASMSKLNL